METAEWAIKRILHDLKKTDADKHLDCATLFKQAANVTDRVSYIQGLIFSCEYVHLLFCAILSQSAPECNGSVRKMSLRVTADR
jgi:hypothetical protein